MIGPEKSHMAHRTIPALDNSLSSHLFSVMDKNAFFCFFMNLYSVATC